MLFVMCLIACNSFADEFDILINDVFRGIQERNRYYNSLIKLKEHEKHLGSCPTGIPCEGKKSSDWGWRRDPWGRGIRFHHGIDIANVIGTPIYSTCDGIVIESGYWDRHGYGLGIKIEGVYIVVYGHLSRVYVKVGDIVRKGDLIGEMGDTGRSTGPHLHYEVRIDMWPGNTIDPMIIWRLR